MEHPACMTVAEFFTSEGWEELERIGFHSIRHLCSLHLCDLISDHTLELVAHGLPAGLAEMYPDDISCNFFYSPESFVVS